MTINDSDIKANSGSLRERTDKNSFVKNIILKIVLPAVLVILLVNLVFQGSKDGKPLDTIRKAKASGNYNVVCKEYEKLIQKDFFNLEYHREYIHSSLNLGRSDNYDDSLDAVKSEYVKYSLDKDVKVSNIGYYGLGYFYSIRDDFKNAFANFNQVKDGNLPYLNNSIGYAYLKSGDREKAKRYFYKEIEIKGNIEGAYSNLAQVLYEERDFSKLKELISDQKIKIFIPYRIIRLVNLKSGQTLSYIADFFNYGYVTSFGFAAAGLILVVWFNYLRRIDIFDSEKQSYLLITLLGGMFFAAICRVFYDIFDYGLRFELNGHIINDLLYCFFGIGLIEETVKIIPFLLILRFTRQINESIDYVIYASVSALGFAFMENLLYFQDPGLRAVTGRALMSVLLHMSMTTFAVYGLFYSRYRKNNQHKMLYFGLSFLTAVVVHGLFDFFLMVKGLPPQVKMLSILILAIAINKFSIIIKNALNVSEFNNEQKIRVESLSWYLVYSICAIVLCQYAVMGWKFGAANANMTMLKPIGLYYFLTLIIIGNLGRIEITKSKWIGFFERKNRLTKQEERVRALAAANSLNFDELKEKYRKWEPAARLSMLFFIFLITGLLMLLCSWGASVRHYFDSQPYRYLMLPSLIIWFVPIFFPAIVLSVIPMNFIFRRLLGKQKCDELEVYMKLKDGSYGKQLYGKRSFQVMSALLIGANCIVLPFLFDYYAKVTDNEIAINKFMGFGETVYPYDKVMELKLVKSQKNGKGEIIRRRYHEIVFDNGYVFSFDHSNYNLNWKKESEIMNFIAKKCCTEIQVIDPYPKRTL